LEAPGLSPDFITDPDAFTCHLSFTLNNFANQCHSDRDSSPYTFVTWLPINKSTGQLVEGPLDGFGGEFVFPKHGFGIDFSGFQGVVECAWKATHFAHLTLPSTTPISSSHTRLGYSVQLPTKTQRALQLIKDEYYKKCEDKKDWVPRDKAKLLQDSLAYPKKKKITNNKDVDQPLVKPKKKL
jgi:hypothetical protein